MNNTRTSLRALLAGAFGAMAAAASVPLGMRFAAARIEARDRAQQSRAERAAFRSQVSSGHYVGRRSNSKRYPEQSSRQAMRGQRRAQGGPGIVLFAGVYEAR